MILLTAAAPISEVRGGVPLGLALGFTPLKAYLLALLGNGLIVLPLLLFLKYGSRWLMGKSVTGNHFLSWLFIRTRRLHGERFENAGVVALALFVAVPLPMTGAWTAAILAFLFDFSLWRSFIAILIGVAVSGAIVLALSMGFIQLF